MTYQPTDRPVPREVLLPIREFQLAIEEHIHS